MAGLLQQGANSPTPSATTAPTAGPGKLDPTLQKIQDGVEAKLPPELKQPYLQVVVAGMRVMFDPATHGLMVERLNQGEDISKSIAFGIAALIGQIYIQSGKKMSIPAAMAASITLMCQALDFAEKSKGLQITPELAATCAQATTRAAMAKFGIGQQQIDQAVETNKQGAA